MVIEMQTGLTPMEKMCASFPAAHERRNGQWTHDDNPRFDFKETDDGTVLVHSWTGKSTAEVLAMGNPPLTMADLYKNGAASKSRFQRVSRDSLDLVELSQYLKIPWQFLSHLGYSEGYPYIHKDGRKTTCVKLGGYCYPDGQLYDKVKVRTSLTGKCRFLWEMNTPGNPIPCGLHKLDMARQHGLLFIGEGESDFATMMFHDLPFLGISGANTVKSLDVSLLVDIPRIYIIEEPDQVQKNYDKGQGFYKEVRSHLRANGYTGEIFSIRFQRVTGHKDPSDLHKAIYRECQQKEEVVHQQEVRAKFAEVMQNALARALPEGNDSLDRQEDEQPDQASPLPETESQLMQWLVQLWEIPATILSTSQKMTFMVIMYYSGWCHRQEGEWFSIETRYLAEKAGMDEKTFLRNLKYLTENLGLFRKNHIKHRLNQPESGIKPKYRTELRITPADDVWLAYPSTWRLTEGNAERKHGGVQTPRPTCNVCGSEDLDEYKAYRCNTCQHTQFVAVKVSPLPFESGPDSEPSHDERTAEHVESTAVALPLTEDDNTTTEETIEQTETIDDRIPNLGILNTSNYKDTQVGYPIPDTENHTDAETILSPIPSALFSLEDEQELVSNRIPNLGIRYTDDEPQGPFPPPQRYTMCCNAVWHWSGERYVCAECAVVRI